MQYARIKAYMKNIIKIIGICILFFMSHASYAAYTPQEKIKQLLEKSITEPGFLGYENDKANKKYTPPGVVVAIDYPDSPEKSFTVSAGSTTIKDNVPIIINTNDQDTLFEIGSITKSFTAVLILNLVEKNYFSLETKLETLLPEYPQWKNITVKQLLNMTSGIKSYDQTPAYENDIKLTPQKYLSEEDIIHFSIDYPLKKITWDYSNTNYFLLAKILEKYDYPDTYEQILYKNFIGDKGEKLQLSNTVYLPKNLNQTIFYQRLSNGYNPDTGYDNQNVKDWSTSIGGPAGGILSNSKDMTIWIRHLFEGPILTTAMRHEMQSHMTCIDNTFGLYGKSIQQTNLQCRFGYSLGIMQAYLNEKIGRVWWYKGSTDGYTAYFMYIPYNRLIVTVLTNQGNSKLNPLSDFMVELMQSLD